MVVGGCHLALDLVSQEGEVRAQAAEQIAFRAVGGEIADRRCVSRVPRLPLVPSTCENSFACAMQFFCATYSNI